MIVALIIRVVTCIKSKEPLCTIRGFLLLTIESYTSLKKLPPKMFSLSAKLSAATAYCLLFLRVILVLFMID